MAHSLSDTAEYLSSLQKEDGSWGNGDPMVCARALYALKELGGEEKALTSGLNYLVNCQKPEGNFPAKSRMYSDASSTAYSLLVLNRFDYGKASIPVSRGILWLLENQAPDGSWGGSNALGMSNMHKRTYTTALCLRALYTFYLSGITRFSRGLDYAQNHLEAMDLASEPVSHVYAPVLHLRRINGLDPEEESRFIEYARSYLEKAMVSGRVADVAGILGALNAIGEKDLSKVASEWLEASQNEDGGFGKEIGAASDVNWSAMVALAILGKL